MCNQSTQENKVKSVCNLTLISQATVYQSCFYRYYKNKDKLL